MASGVAPAYLPGGGYWLPMRSSRHVKSDNGLSRLDISRLVVTRPKPASEMDGSRKCEHNVSFGRNKENHLTIGLWYRRSACTTGGPPRTRSHWFWRCLIRLARITMRCGGCSERTVLPR
jgi:hypothetical protein